MKAGARTYRRQLAAIAKAAGGTLETGRHFRIRLPGGHIVPASGTPGGLRGGRPVRVEREVARAVAGERGRLMRRKSFEEQGN